MCTSTRCLGKNQCIQIEMYHMYVPFFFMFTSELFSILIALHPSITDVLPDSGQYTNLLYQSSQLGLTGQWSAVKESYAVANRLLGDIIKGEGSMVKNKRCLVSYLFTLTQSLIHFPLSRLFLFVRTLFSDSLEQGRWRHGAILGRQ